MLHDDFERSSMYLIMSEYLNCLSRAVVVMRSEHNQIFFQQLESMVQKAPLTKGVHFSEDQQQAFYIGTSRF